jgi:hypothetical protein
MPHTRPPIRNSQIHMYIPSSIDKDPKLKKKLITATRVATNQSMHLSGQTGQNVTIHICCKLPEPDPVSGADYVAYSVNKDSSLTDINPLYENATTILMKSKNVPEPEDGMITFGSNYGIFDSQSREVIDAGKLVEQRFKSAWNSRKKRKERTQLAIT